MADSKNLQLASSITEIIRESVKSTIALLFNVAIDSCALENRTPAADNFMCCGELIQDDARAKLMFLFDRALITRLLQCTFTPAELTDPKIYESAALEIVNIVGNNLKTYLNVRGYKLHMALPYVPDRDRNLPAGEDPLVQLAFSLKDNSAMGVDFYMRRA